TPALPPETDIRQLGWRVRFVPAADRASHRLCVAMYTRARTLHRAPKHPSARPRCKLSVLTGPKVPDRAPGYGAFCGIMVMPVGPMPVNWTITSPSFAHA